MAGYTGDWDPDERDTEGWLEEAICPKLIDFIQKILSQYPDDGQIFKEMIQNAEDAGANTVTILADTRHFHQSFNPVTLERFPHLKYFKGPALCIYNNQEFTSGDWRSIRMLHQSVKEKNPMKVGRFGLGFKSVFHLTDVVVIISGKRILYMDPSKDERHYCVAKLLCDVRGRELESILQCVEGPLFGISRETFRRGHFQGTVFWVPLRLEPTKMSASSTAYTEQNLQDLLRNFRDEGSSMLLFLNNIEQIHGYTRDSEVPQKLFSVGIAASCLQNVQCARRSFFERIPEGRGQLPTDPVYSELIVLSTETTDHVGLKREEQTSLIVNYFPGTRELSGEQQGLCTNLELNYRPCVGVAHTVHQESGLSQVFCTLPLPLGTRSMTGLPVHVNGCFAVSSNRRHLEWPDSRRRREFFENTVQWNLFLVEVLLPRAYARLLENIVQMRSVSAQWFYSIWPDISRADARWRLLAENVYRKLATKSCFFTEADGGKYIRLNQAVLSRFPSEVPLDVAKTIVNVCKKNSVNLVELPAHVEKDLDLQGFLAHVRCVNPNDVCRLLHNCLHDLNREERLNVLEYLCLLGATSDLENLELLPLADGTFGVFSRRSPNEIYWCDERLLSLFPDMLSKFCDTNLQSALRQYLFRIAVSGTFSLRVLSDDSSDVPRLVRENLVTRSGPIAPTLSLGDAWIEQVWRFLSATRPWDQNLEMFKQFALLPVVSGHVLKLLPLTGVYVCLSSHGVCDALSPDLCSCLTKLQVTVLQDVPYCVQWHRCYGQLVQPPSADGILRALEQIAKKSELRVAAVQQFNSHASERERNELVGLLEKVWVIDSDCRNFLMQLKMFTQAGGGQFVSVQEVNCIAPDEFPPVLPRQKFLCCSRRSEYVAVALGARQTTLKEIVADMLMLMLGSSLHGYSTTDVSKFMNFFIDRRDLLDDQYLLSVARQVKFVRTTQGHVKAADELYDPTSPDLAELFEALDLLPSADFRRPTVLEKLQLLGLRTEANVQEEHLLAAAVHINTEFCRGVLAALRKSNALWALLVKYGNNFTPTTLERISHIQCMPCLHAEEKPMGYPESLPLKSTPALVKSEELYTHTRVRLIGSVVPIARSDISEHVSSMLQINTQMYLDHVVQHLRRVTKHYTLGEAPQYRLLLIEIFTVLTQHTHNTAVERLKKEKCALVESGDRFVRPCNVWNEKGEDDIDLKPYRFPLASYLHTFKGLFLSCGSHQSQDEAMLRDVIVEIQRKHERLNVTPEKCSDLKLVKEILTRLKEEDSACDGTVLIPVQIPENPLALRFKPAKDCTIVSGGMEAASSRSAAIYIVNPQITPDTARALGALDMRARAMEGLEAIDFGYGQREDLIDRLKDLLEHSYRDGLSVPKELIQNADDAGARKVFFLLDERENPDARSNLFYPQMASQQGPAVWAYNDAKFSDKDIANITRLGAQTKEDASKVGKFGLGFNAVYNLTDTPCYLSGHFMGMFDPEGKYLGGNPGMKLNFRDPQNQALVSRMPQQFEPFQGVFGCHLKDDGTPISYEGTLFRFPLRTPQQEAESRLNAKCYNREKRREFLKLILESAGNLLMFTQSVHVLEIFHIADDNSDPGSPDCLLSMSKTSRLLHGVSLGETAILQFCTHRWQTQQDIKIYEELDVNVKMTNIAEDLCEVKACDSTTHWRVAWATGTGESAGIARSRSHRYQSLLPLAAVAVPLDKGCILQLDQLPPGFYHTGHLFCFLPLPEELGHGALPVHVNSTFSLTSSRRSLLEQTEDDVDSLKTKWNRALFVDPVCRAYILLLESLQGVAQKDDYSAYFHLWPQAASGTVQEMKVSFYKHVTAGRSMLFPVPHTGRWVDFQTARFLEPTFRDSECGSIALKVLQKFWKGDGSIVDVPINICLLIKAAEEKAFKTKVVTKAAFYKDVFFPNIKDGWWKPNEREKERDRLILHALLQDHQDIQRLLQNHQCIPCEGTPDLRRPGDLIHPEKEAAKLFLPSEGFFPQCKDPKENTHVVHFRSKKILERLAKLGMTTDDLSPDRVLERTKSVAALFAVAESRQLALDRACRVVDYLSSYSALHSKLRIDLLPPETKATLSDIMFLPVLRKPEHWPFPWEGDADQPELASPSNLFVDSLRDLVACSAKLLNSHSLGYAGSQQEEKTRVLALLGVGVDKDHENKQLLTLTIAQLKTIAGEYRKYRSINKETLQAVLVAIYSFLDQCLGFSHQTAVFISEHLASVECVWAENEFVLPRHVAFHSKFDCRPYLYKLEGNLEQYMRLFEKLGVKEKFSTTDGLDVLKRIHEEKTGSQLSEDEVRLVGRVAQMVCEAKQDDGGSIDKSQVFLPDRECFMCPVDSLCFDDTEWLSSNDSMKFLNGKIPPETARILGVKTKKREDFVRMAKALPWAQKEELTTRIKRLLQGYTFDSSILQELIQNAEDARATEIHFIKDFRNLSTERVVEGCSFLQGPALCVYNNSFFTEEDLKGIISLGEGSKGLEPLKVGQYGVGFNAVYHLTDIPSFWTRRSDGKEVMVVLDPNCQHLPVEGGVRLEEIDQNSYSDTFQGFLRDCQPEYMSKPGTLFRFPLRTEEMAKTSQIKDLPVTESQLTEMIDSFMKEMERCLLFLNSVRSIGIYTVSEEGTLKCECQVAKQLDEPSNKELKRFQCYLEEAAAKLKEGAQPTDIEEFESVLFMSIKNSRDCAEEWLTVNRIGFASMARREQMQTNFRGENFKCLPSGGVAVQLSESSAEGQAPPPTKDCLAFCVLPLPVCTGLPMHINGHFALDHETRRGLWDNKDDARTAWNKAIALQIVVPAYITAIQRVKNVWFSADEGGTRSTSTYLQHYHSLFPDLQNAFSTYPWKLLMEELYRQIARLELPLFPVVREDISIITWAPVVKTDGFPGYFSDSVKFFKEISPVTKDSDKRKAEERNKFHRLLKGLNMKVLYTPYSAMWNFVESGVEHVQEVCPATVITFLKSASSTQEGKCALDSLPRPVSDTPFQDATNVELFLEFVKTDKEFAEKMEGLPLCLRQSGQLHVFEKAEDVLKPIVSTFLRLLPQSSDRFLHDRIFNYFLPMEESTKEMIQELDIPLFARLLPETILEPIYKTGKPCPFLIGRHPCPDKHPDQTWLKALWKFLKGQLKLPSEEGTENPHNSRENKLECLADWSLIPVKKQNGRVEEQLLFPIQDAQSVVHLSASRDKSRPQLLETLKSLPLPFLNTLSLPILSIATELVASISHPAALLHALTSCGTCLTKLKEDASRILSYFNDSLPTLQESFKDDGRLRQKLKHLPFFSSIGGDIGPVSENTLTICIRSSVPDEGLSQWLERRQNSVLLLRLADVPHNLQEFLGFTVASDLEFYCGYVLPSFADLPKNAMLIHMTYVRELLEHKIHQEDEEERLCLQLQQTAFVECQGHLHRARYFFSPNQPVFNQMCPADRFPPEPYSKSEWRYFMRKAGIIWEVTVDMFIDFARMLEEEGQVGVTEGVAEKSGVLVRHLYDVPVSTQRLKDTCLFQEIRNIRFLLQSDWTAQRGKRRYLALVARPLIQDRLVSFAESCSERHLHLVWTSSPIIHGEADPYSKAPRENLREILQQLDWQECAPEDKVKKHVHNLCAALQVADPENSPAWNDSSVGILDTVMMDVYNYLDSMSDLTELIKLPLVCDTENKRLFHAENVVIYASEDEVFAECIQKLPVKFGGFASLFKRLGVSKRPTASHYARVLSHIKRQRGDSQLEDEDTNNVKKAVQGLFKCLRSNVEEERRLQVDHLYLPSEQNKLLKSSELVFSNDQHLKDRYEELPHRQLDFLQDFSLLQIRVPRPQDDIRRLPEEHKVRSLSDIVKVVIPDEIRIKAFDGDFSQSLKYKLVQPECVACVIRLAYHQHMHEETSRGEFNEETERSIAQQMFLINVKEITGLKTVLVEQGQVLEDSEMSQSLFVYCSDDGKYALYLDTEKSRSRIQTSRGLALAIQSALEFLPSLASNLQNVFEDPTKASKEMDLYGIEQYKAMTVEDTSMFPPLGTYVPTAFHLYLVYRVDSGFLPGQRVAYELYDPLVNEDDTEDNVPCYVCAVVMKRIEERAGGDTTECFSQYIIDPGPDHGGEREVSGTELYKLCQQPVRRENRGDVAVPLVLMSQEEGTVDAEDLPPNIDEVLRQIRQTLTEAWRQPCLTKRRRVVMRLYMQWNPARNFDKEFCTKVIKRIKQCVALLDHGMSLDAEYTAAELKDFSNSPSFLAFFVRLDERCRRNNVKSDAEVLDFRRWSGRRRPNPQPGGAVLYIRQAEADLAAAQAARGTCDKGHNWICYQCHQAVEKALKAVILDKNAVEDSLSHDLTGLAEFVHDPDLISVARQLEVCVGRHTHMRYPHCRRQGKIPADVYVTDEARDACGYAEQALQRARRLLMRGRNLPIP